MSSVTLGRVASASRRRALALAIVLAAQCMFAMDLLIVVVALPRIQHDLGFNPASLSWVLNAFGLAFGGLLLLGGRLGDMLGQVRAFRIGLAVFVFGSLLGGLAQTPGLLIAARVLQGAGAALAGPSVLALVIVMARNAAEQARGMSLFIAVSSVGASAGLILGGVLTEYLSWRWALLINVPVGIIVLLTIGRLIAETVPKPARLDVVGAVSATLASVALVYGFVSAADHGWSAAGTLLSFALVLPMLVLFIRVQRRHREPLLDLHLLRDRSRTGGLLVMALIVGMHFSLLFMLVQYLQRIMGYTPLMAGFAYLPLTATVFAISHVVPRLIVRFGARVLLATGSVLVAASLAGFALLGSDASYFPAVLLPLLIHAVGIALVFAPGTVAIMHGVPDEHAGAASGLLQMDQQIGGALGIAVITSIHMLTGVPGQYAAGLPAAFGAGAAIALVAAGIAWGAVRGR
ncbi:MFS transporter [Janthinobacterium sp.]|uniref:MFS transporter n=1 Tax=Janthinobacterium sp. TaxID=1871054 RepID=UPI0028968787|nr:MFS transporter [Janthinobacterium sp.]